MTVLFFVTFLTKVSTLGLVIIKSIYTRIVKQKIIAQRRIKNLLVVSIKQIDLN